MIFVVNAGSSSLKVALFDGAALCASGAVTEIGASAALTLGAATRPVSAPDHEAALALLIAAFADAGFPFEGVTAAGHRVVHGGRRLMGTVRITPAALAEIEAAVPLAPLHNPHNLSAIRALARLAPDLPQVACFDTAFHATNPEVALRFALPASEEARGLRRYGFHGISYESLAGRLPGILGRLPERVLALHLGNGASLCAIAGGRSVATTMGYSPLDGLTMGSRTGAIDGNAVLRLAEIHGIDGAARILNRESGLKGLGGQSDMRALRAAGTPEAAFAIAHFAYWAVRHAGSMIAAMGGLDCLAFTGGIGEHDQAMRAEICAGLAYMGVRLDDAANRADRPRLEAGGPPVLIVPAEEEAHIARATAGMLGLGT
ncbi:MAG: acetate kinase [Defluviimonas sp.]|uniref:acetate/propionate family kinase n=1 Tax=Albidovulum sp. TaxID=1872424 RepID=UPI001DF1CFD9|nr:acetate kinase [Paracoccaceae bacterium]MCC0063888.1 acetate kinase [Defluviimonas sp.]